jgi:hypothetical protein
MSLSEPVLEIWLEKNGLKLADPARKHWPSISPGSAHTLHGNQVAIQRNFSQSNGKWWAIDLVRHMNFMDEIDIVLGFTADAQRRICRERIIVWVDHINHTLQQWG